MTRQEKENLALALLGFGAIAGSIYLGSKLFGKKDSKIESLNTKRRKLCNKKHKAKLDSTNIESNFENLQDFSHNIESRFYTPQDLNTESNNLGIYINSNPSDYVYTKDSMPFNANTFHAKYDLPLSTPLDSHIRACPSLDTLDIHNFSSALDYLQKAKNLKNIKADSNDLESLRQNSKDFCVSETIKAIYKIDYINSSAMQSTRKFYIDDLVFFKNCFNAIKVRNFTNIKDFVDSFCKENNCQTLHIKSEYAADNSIEIYLDSSTMYIKSFGNLSLNSHNIQNELLRILRKWYIYCKLKDNVFPLNLWAYMRYIEINFRYFYVRDRDDVAFKWQPFERDIGELCKVW